MAYWLMKSEPKVFSIEDLRLGGVCGWDGVRNYQARNFIKAMRSGDLALFYHSNAAPSGVAGFMEVVRPAYPDPSQFNPGDEHCDPRASRDEPIWFQVDVKWRETFSRLLTLDEMKKIAALARMPLFKRSRLSVSPVTGPQWKSILRATKR